MSDYPMLISNKLHSFRNFGQQKYDDILGLSENFLSICNLFPYSFRLTSRKQ